MKHLRKGLILFLVFVMAFSLTLPALADELDGEELLIDEAIGEQTEEAEPEGSEEDESVGSEVEETEEEPESELESDDEEAVPEWQEPGNSSLNILGGGTMLECGDRFFSSADGIVTCTCGDDSWPVCYDDARNLNLCGDVLYYTCDGVGIKRLSLSGGEAECVLSYDGIEQLYVCGSVFYFLADGNVYRWQLNGDEPERVSGPEAVRGFIPTSCGFVFLTGEVFSRTVWAGETAALENVESCYTDGDYLVVNRAGTWQIALAELFAGNTSLDSYDLHQDEIEIVDLPLDEQLKREAEFFDSEIYLENETLGEEEESEVGPLKALFSFSLDGSSGVSLDGSSVYFTAQQIALSNNDMNRYNITRRARQQAEVLWTPLKDRYAWGARSYHAERTVTSEEGTTTNYFVANNTYQGIPYSQAVYTSAHPYGGYVGWDLSMSDYINAVNNQNSRFYTDYSTHSQTAPAYGSDCAAFVAWAWDLSARQTCSSLVYFSNYIGNSINQLQLGDCLNCTSSHVVLVTDIGYNSAGQIVAVEITEQTPLIMRVTNYGEKLPNKTNPHIRYVSSLSTLQSNYLNSGYDIYRRDVSSSVSYKAEAAIPLTEDGWLTVPRLTTDTSADGKSVLVSLSHKDGYSIRYTTDGSKATLSSPLYTGPIAIGKTTTIHAIADYSASSATGAFELVYTVDVTSTDKPALKLVSGALSGEKFASGSVISLASNNGAKVYYTTDGSEPTLNSPVMSVNGITVTSPITLKAFAIADGFLRSETVSFSLTLGQFHTIHASSAGGGTISPGGDVKVLDGDSPVFTFTASTQYKVADVIVDGQSIGKQASYKFNNVKGDHEISVKFAVSLPFTDVKESGWYADAVAFAYSQGLFNGTSSTTFGPNEKMNRGMFVTVLGRFAGQKSYLENFTQYTIGYSNGTAINIRQSASTSANVVGSISNAGSFVTVRGTTKDSAGDSWYYVQYGGVTGYVKMYYNGKNLINCYDGKFADISGQYYNGYTQWAYMKGLVNGTSTTRFSPKQNISRQDICVIFYNYLTKYLGRSISTGSKTFSDDGSIASYAKTAVHAMANIGIVNGYDDGSFCPTQLATRAEVATMFMRLYSYLNG